MPSPAMVMLVVSERPVENNLLHAVTELLQHGCDWWWRLKAVLQEKSLVLIRRALMPSSMPRFLIFPCIGNDAVARYTLGRSHWNG